MALIGDILYRLKADYSDLDKKSKAASKSLRDTEKSSDKLQGSFDRLGSAVGDLGGVFKSVVAGVMAGSMAILMKSAAMTAARTQVLGTSLLVVGENAGYLRDELAAEEKSLKSLGITTQVARTTLTRMISTEMDATRATELANAARNLAVISGKNTSQTLETLIHGLVTMQAETLRTVGVTLNMDEASRKYGETIGKNVKQMTMAERRQGILNEIVKYAASLEGVYETAMGDVGKQLTSFARYTEEAANAFAEFLLPALNKVIIGLGNLVKWYTKLDPEIRRLITTVALFTTTIMVLGAVGIALAALIPILSGIVAAFAAFVIVNPILLALTVLIAALASAWATNLGGIQEKSRVVFTAVGGVLVALYTTVKSTIGGIIAYYKLLYDVMSEPWKIGESFAKFRENITALAGETKDAWVGVVDATVEACKDVERASEESNVALKKGTLKLTEEQKKARNDLRAYTGKVTKAQIDELVKLHGKELADFITKEKKKYDVQQANTKERLMIADRYQKALEDIHKKELKSKAALEKAKIQIEAAMGRISEEESIRRSHEIAERSYKAEIKILEKSLPERLALMKKLQKPEEDIRAARLKGEAAIEDLRRKMAAEGLKSDMNIAKLREEQYSRENTERIAQLEHRHALEVTAEKEALEEHQITREEVVTSEGLRQKELLELRLSIIREEMTALEEQGRAEGEIYQELALQERETLRERREAYVEHVYEVGVIIREEAERRAEDARMVEDTILSLKKEALDGGLSTMQEYNSLELEEYDLQTEEMLRRMAERYASTEELDEGYALRQAGRRKLEQAQTRSLREAQLSYAQIYASTAEELFTTLYEMGGKQNKKYFYLAKAAAMAQAIVNTALAVTKALAEGGPFAGPALAALMVALGMVQIAKISAQTMALGGEVKGGSGTKDDVHIMAKGGEFFHPPESVKHYGLDFMEGIRTRSIPKEIFSGLALPKLQVSMPTTHFQAGGPVPTAAPPSPEGVAPTGEAGVNIINVSDPNEALRFLATRPGEEAVLNIIGRRGQTVRRMLR